MENRQVWAPFRDRHELWTGFIADRDLTEERRTVGSKEESAAKGRIYYMYCFYSVCELFVDISRIQSDYLVGFSDLHSWSFTRGLGHRWHTARSEVERDWKERFPNKEKQLTFGSTVPFGIFMPSETQK